ncbi:choice-of-anchor I family protein [Cyanobium sp. Morenito 9A2]|uniref:choice-of-anchor I family protein n=1 Tax=Cyanobium sp. Morenito 9A2 TaxID=2823718 RepID=UPI0020CC8E21|nr:choice-of-anchor I family protein [Cyanobium sp. Morenito 9A2]MCP9850415.1 choice-of-anchor I family protein [Cyanobium sp. Morenito 9A2]
MAPQQKVGFLARSIFDDLLQSARSRRDDGPRGGRDDDRDRRPPAPANPLLGSLNLSTGPQTPNPVENFQTEISASVRIGGKLFILSSGGGSTLQVTDATNPALPGAPAVAPQRISFAGYNSQSVATKGNLVAVALSPIDYATNGGKGLVRFYRLAGDGSVTVLRDVEVGYLPDSIAFNGDGTKLVIANEGEPIAGYGTDPLNPSKGDPIGSIGIIDIKGMPGRRAFTYTDLTFAGLTLPSGIRISGPPGTSQLTDIEPEYVSILGKYAYVTLQENNGVAKVNLEGRTIEKIFALGAVDFSKQLVDLTDRDASGAGFKPMIGQPYEGLRQPDGIAAYRVGGRDYFITANEGDARDYPGYLDEARGSGADRVKRLKDDATVGAPDRITTFGGRSISLFDADTGALLWDSGNILQTIAVAAGVYDDGRSDDKGVEPEGVVVAKLRGRTYAIVSTERTTSSLLAVFDVTDPAASRFVTSTVIPGSLSPEGLKVIKADESTTGRDLLVVSNEVSNTLNVLDLQALIAAPPVAGAGAFKGTMLKDVAGGAELRINSLITNGEVTAGLTPFSTPYTPTGLFDGLGAYANGDGTYTLLVNSELGAAVGYQYTAEGLTGPVTGARISKFIVDIDTDDRAANGFQSKILRGGLAYDKVIGADTNGFDRFCSGALVQANSFGSGLGFADRLYLAGEESSAASYPGAPAGGAFYALDVANDDLYEVPGFGRAGFENATLINTGSANTVAVLLFDDSAAPLYLWVGNKTAGGFLERNGLAAANGSLYAWKPTSLPDANGSAGADTADLNAVALSTPVAGRWVKLGTGTDVSALSAVELRTLALGKGAQQFQRIEDGDVNPSNGQQVVFNTTGGSGADLYGNVQTIDFMGAFAANGTLAPTGSSTLRVIYDADRLVNPAEGIRSPDNLAWSADGSIYIQEDRSVAPSSFATQEASIWKLNPTSLDPLTGQALTSRWAQIDRSAVPGAYGQSDGAPLDAGNWESSGIIDVSSIYGAAPGSFFLADVQAHSLTGGNLGGGSGYLVEGGQLVLIEQRPDLF